MGGQALAFWADHYGVLGQGFEAGPTRDLDFFGTGTQARAHIAQLQKTSRFDLRFEIATIDTPPPSSAVILIDNFGGRPESLIIDYVTALAGYCIESEERMRRRTVDVSIGAVSLKCMHPFDCLKSRVHNVALIPGKDTELGIEQCRTAVRVVRRMLDENCLVWSRQRNIALKMAEAVIDLALHPHSLEARLRYDVDVMAAINPDSFCSKFRSTRWPQANAYVERKYAQLVSRVSK